MICLKCDVCGNAFDFGKKVPNQILFIHIESTGRANKTANHDICPDCYAAIKKTIDDRRKRGIDDPMEDDLK